MKREKTKYMKSLVAEQEKLFGVPPEELSSIKFRDTFTVHKSAKKGQNSFRITKSLLDSLYETYKQIQKRPILVISIVDGSDEYTITCSITKK
jgi:hypothetical protein